MDYLEDKLGDFEKALVAFREAVTALKSVINRDASLKRFEFTFELMWKTIKLYLKEVEKIDCYSPASCLREARITLGINDEITEICLSMGEDRNLSVHTYSEKMADELYKKFPKYLETMELIAKKIKEKSNL